MSLNAAIQAAVQAAFEAAGDLVQTVTYIRPPGFNPLTSAIAGAEARVSCPALVPPYAPSSFALREPGALARVQIQAASLAAIDRPAPGDLILMPDGSILLVIGAFLGLGGWLWTFTTSELPAADHGDLTAFASAEDYGDLTAATAVEDYGALF